ncbi:hypothetical protein CR513_49339, partial [Mucuna pruriens]
MRGMMGLLSRRSLRVHQQSWSGERRKGVHWRFGGLIFLVDSLIDCPYAKSVWYKLVDLHLPAILFCYMDVFNWVAHNLRPCMPSSRNWHLIFGVTVDVLWRLRNDMIFPTRNYLLTKKVTSSEFIGWNPPPSDWVCDASITSGGVLRNDAGNFYWDIVLLPIMGYFPLTPFDLESKIIIESDSLSAVHMVNQGCSSSHPASPLVTKIRQLMALAEHVQCNHARIEANQGADSLTNLALFPYLSLTFWI